jgi:hypothetical protein
MFEYLTWAVDGHWVTDAELNKFAAEGWRVISVSWRVDRFAAVLLERPKAAVAGAMEGK